jgi:alpha-beta hydrolase superfamily lysophospholipase
MVDAIKKAGGTKAKLTIYPGVNHNSWSKTYANEKVYAWLLSHSKAKEEGNK